MDTTNKIPEPRGELELDLWRGQIIDSLTGAVISFIDGWSKQLGIIATESFIATRAPCTGLQCLDLAVLWPGWFENATYLQDIRRRVDAPLWRTSTKLAPFGWTVQIIDKWICTVSRDPDFNGKSIPIRAAQSFPRLERIEDAFQADDFDAVLKDALAALEICRESHHVRLLIGACCFRHGLEPPAMVKVSTARHLLEYQSALQVAVNTLSCAYGNERDRNPRRWAFVQEKINQYEGQLKTLEDVFERAKFFLRVP